MGGWDSKAMYSGVGGGGGREGSKAIIWESVGG